MGEELKAIIAQEIRKYLLIGAGILFGFMIIGAAVISVFAGVELENSSTGIGNFGGSNVQLEGMNLYNSDGTVNLEAIQELETFISRNYLGLDGPGLGHENYDEVADWLQEGLIFQCPWWAVGRANWFLEQIGSEKRVAMDDGGSVITNSHNVSNFTIGTEPRPNSLICWNGTQYGHIAYVEAVDPDGTIYFSETGNGTHWYGITSLPSGSYNYSSNLNFQGFLYLTDEEYVLNNTTTDGGANVNATLSADDMQNVNSMLTFAKSLEGCSLSQVKNNIESNESTSYGGDWCSWFCWNMYYRYGFIGQGSWTSSYNRDTSLAYAAGWMYMDEDAYNGYIRSVPHGNTNYVPKAGDLVLFASSEYPLAAHVGMVASVGNKQISTVEGNMSGAVNLYTWNISGGTSDYIGDTSYYEIKGYYSLAQSLANQ